MPLLDVAATVAALADSTLTVERPAGPDTYDDLGRLVKAGPTSFPIDASVQPATARDRLLLPEGFRARQTIAVWSTGNLRPSDEGTGVRGDRVTWQGEVYEVTALDPWANVGGYVKALATRITYGG